jgi:hypothetical protein
MHLISSLTRAIETVFGQIDNDHQVGCSEQMLSTNVSLPTRRRIDGLIVDDLQAGPLGAARQRPSGGEVFAGSERRGYA